jgi:hypothetical protein
MGGSSNPKISPPDSASPCRSGGATIRLAREGGDTFNIAATDRPLSRAGSLPQMGRCQAQISKTPAIPCKSGLAREDGGTFNITVTDRPLSRASPLPHWDSARHKSPKHPQSPVGAGLAREGGDTFNIAATDRPLSRAGSLPQMGRCQAQRLRLYRALQPTGNPINALTATIVSDPVRCGLWKKPDRAANPRYKTCRLSSFEGGKPMPGQMKMSRRALRFT